MSTGITRPTAAASNGKPLPYTMAFPSSLVREAAGLDAYEKAFLFMLASHKNLKSTRSREGVERATGFKGNRIYAVRKKLAEKGLITWSTSAIGKHTVYTIDKHALLGWVENPDKALLWASNDKALRRAAARQHRRPYRLGEEGVRELLKKPKRV